jgi:hypothetical protein
MTTMFAALATNRRRAAWRAPQFVLGSANKKYFCLHCDTPAILGTVYVQLDFNSFEPGPARVAPPHPGHFAGYAKNSLFAIFLQPSPLIKAIGRPQSDYFRRAAQNDLEAL